MNIHLKTIGKEKPSENILYQLYLRNNCFCKQQTIIDKVEM